MTSLFSVNELLHKQKAEVEENKAFGIYLSAEELVVSLGQVKDSINEIVGDITDLNTRMIVSMGHWSMHDLMFSILESTGPAKVHFTTWQISDRAIRMFSEGMKTGLITELNSVLDRRIKIRRSDALFFTEKVCNRISLVDCHAKISLIENQRWKVSIFSSANLTKNTRIEFYIIYFDEEVFNFNKKWITAQINGSQPFNPEGFEAVPETVLSSTNFLSFADLRRKTGVHKRNPFYFTSFYDNIDHIELHDLKVPENVSLIARPLASLLNVNFAGNKNDIAIYTTPKRHNKDFHFATAICQEVSRLTKIKFLENVFTAENLDKLALEQFRQIREVSEPVLILIDDILTTGRTITRCIIPGKSIFYYIGINNNA